MLTPMYLKISLKFLFQPNAIVKSYQVYIHLEIGSESLWNEGVSLHDLVKHLMRLNRRPDISQQHLEPGPERQQCVHEVTGLQMWPKT